MELVIARGALLEQILDETYPLWHEGLTRRAYGQWNAAQMKTPWGAEHLQRFALVNGSGALLSTAKRYRLAGTCDGRTVGVSGIGALFTPPASRGRGNARALLDRLFVQERAAGSSIAALFSEIGPAFYEGLAFRPVPLDEVTIRVAVKAGAPAMLVRAGVETDFPAIAAMHDVRSAGARFALRRDPPFLHYALSKKRLLAGLGPEGLRQVEFHVAEEGSSAVAYVVLSVNAHGWTLDEAGDRDPSGARLGAILQVLVAREPSLRPPLVRAWWPRSFPVPPQLALTDRSEARDLFMMRALADDVSLPTREGDAFYWRGDFF
jgi:GNAT superfamily N-acetyltransferase